MEEFTLKHDNGEYDRILAFMCKQLEEIMDIYAQARAAKLKFIYDDDYELSNGDIDSLIMLAAAYSAILRKAYRIFIIELGYEKASFWNAYIFFAVFRQHVLFDEVWKKTFENDKKLLGQIRKTSNPTFVEKTFTGDITWKWLLGELEK